MARVVVITGGASGIGLAAARRFATGGDSVVLIDRDTEAVNREAAALPDALPIVCDIADEAAVVAAFAEVVARRGRIDVLVNNAGVIDPDAMSALEVPLTTVRAIMAINLDGAFVAAREAGRAMLTAGNGGAIVNIASMAGVVALPNRLAYSASKAALIGLTRTLATEWAGSNIRVNAILPGYVETEIITTLRRGGKIDAAQVERRIPLGRLAEPDEIAAVVEHLASSDAGYTVGATLAVDGGYQAFGGTGAASEAGAVRPTERARDRVVLITGGASGIGAATATLLAERGNHICILDRSAPASGQAHHFIETDITDEAQVASAIVATLDRFGRIDVLINNAGIADKFSATTDQSLADFRRVMDVNLIGAMLVAQAAAPAMIAQGGGAIVNVASIAATAGLPRRNAYCASKTALLMLTRSLACEWARHAIRVNAVAPGYIATPGVAALEAQGLRDFATIRQRTPLGHLGEPAEIAAAIAFLASPDASYITGALYAADGGWSAYGDAGPAWEPTLA